QGMTNVQTSGVSDIARTYLQHRYSILFYVLLLTMVSGPLLSGLRVSATLIESFLAASLLAAILPVNEFRRRRSLVFALVAIWLARPLASWLGHRSLSAITLVTWTAIGLISAAAALRFSMSATKVDSEHLYAALSAYLLAGIYFGLLYWVLEELNPGTFIGNG